jgi:NAD(P)-dependent dehydrogenase (short-subunit alcohol dehydrogenase family)
MEGAESTIVYTHEEQKDAEETKQLVEKKGGKLHLIPADLQSQKTCKEVVDKALETMGRINILVLNHGTQMMVEDIKDLSEYVVLFPWLCLGLWDGRLIMILTGNNGSIPSTLTSILSSSSQNILSLK